MANFDFIVVGGGISGASAASLIALHGRTLLIEAEAVPGYHSTGRSAALYTPNYGAPLVRALNMAGHSFFTTPPEGFSPHPLLTPRGALTLARPGEEERLAAVLALSTGSRPVEPVAREAALALAPFLRPEMVGAGAFEPDVADMDVAAIHQGFLARFRAAGGQVALNSRLSRLDHRGGRWHLEAGEGVHSTRIVVNAAGAWGDAVAELGGIRRRGLQPKRRTVIGLASDMPGIATMPMVEFVGEEAYLKPDTGQILASPGDETPVEPQDIQAEEWDIAVAADWVQSHTLLRFNRIDSAWAGLRSFLPDHLPAAGFDAGASGFFWLVGQGGYGIMMAPALARATQSLVCGLPWPTDFVALGITAEALSPARAG